MTHTLVPRSKKSESGGFRRLRWAGLWLLFIVAPGIWAEAPSPGEALISTITGQYIIPAHQALEKEAQALANSARAFCGDMDRDVFEAVRAQWKSAMNSWSRLAPVRYGPIDDFNMIWRFQFWPDPINLVHRKFKSRIRGKNPDNTPEALDGASVAIQGLSALEYLLFDPKVGGFEHYVDAPHRCPILVSTAGNLVRNAQRITQAWESDYGKRWLHVKDSPDPAAMVKLKVETIYSGVVMALGTITNDKLGKPLSIKKNTAPDESLEGNEDTVRRVNPWQLESWRSQTSLEHIRVTVDTAWELYTMKHSLSDYLAATGVEDSGLDARIREQFAAAQKALDGLNQSAFELLQNKQAERLEVVHGRMNRLYHTLKIDYARAANIVFRFNAADGD